MAGGVAVFNVALQVPAAAQAFRDSLARDKCWQAQAGQGAAMQQMKKKHRTIFPRVVSFALVQCKRAKMAAMMS